MKLREIKKMLDFILLPIEKIFIYFFLFGCQLFGNDIIFY
jgi:hypothetical protein